MILVELTRDMRPWKAGQSYLLPDVQAMALIANGEAKNPRDRFGAPIPLPSPACGRGAGGEGRPAPAPPKRKYATK